MDPQNIPLVMLLSFGGVLFTLGILLLKAMQYLQRQDEEAAREQQPKRLTL